MYRVVLAARKESAKKAGASQALGLGFKKYKHLTLIPCSKPPASPHHHRHRRLDDRRS